MNNVETTPGWAGRTAVTFKPGVDVAKSRQPILDDGKPACLITGSGRSGTRFMSILLTQAGLPCTHEYTSAPWSEGKPPSHRDCSWIAAPRAHELIKRVRIVHLVRDPIDVISSQHHHKWLRPNSGIACNVQEASVPEIKAYNDLLDRTVVAYIGWNQRLLLLEGHPNYRRHRVEGDARDLLCWLGGSPSVHLFDNTKCNAYGDVEKLTLSDIREPFRQQFIRIRNYLGYS